MVDYPRAVTQAVVVTNSDWVNLGLQPLMVELSERAAVMLVLAAVKPQPADQGHVLNSEWDVGMNFRFGRGVLVDGPSYVWARAMNVLSATLIVTPGE